MKQQLKKLLCLLLACVLAFGLLPGAALAEGIPPTANDAVTMEPLTPAQSPAPEETPAPVEPEPSEAPLPDSPAPADLTPPAGEPVLVPLPELDGDWTYFRGNLENNGVTDAATPATAGTAALKWAQKYGTGWSAAPTPPLILDGKLYIAMSDRVVVIEKETGAELDRSEAMVGTVGFAMNPIAYGGGRIYVPLSSGRIQALRADTLELLWDSEKMEGVSQTNSPVVYRDGYVYTGIWGGEEKPGSYFCLDAETGELVWSVARTGGFYWAGAYVADRYLVVGSGDSAPENTYTETAALLSLDSKTGAVLDQLEGIKGDIRSSVCYDNGKVYFATKGGWFCSVAVGGDGMFDHSSFQYVDLKGMCTGTPMVYNGRAYIGSSGAAQFTGPGYLNVIDLSGSAPEVAYRAELPGYPQASALATSAYGDDAYVYITYNQRPGGIYAIKDRPGQTEAAGVSVFTPDPLQQNYGICSLVCDADGTLYYKNDSCYLMAVERSAAYAKDLTLDKRELTLGSGEAATLTATMGQMIGTQPQEPLTWSSSNEAVATVDQSGKVTCVGGGKAVITVSGALAFASCAVTSTAPISLTVSAYDYTATDAGLPGASATGAIMSGAVEVPSTSTAAQAVEAAFAAAHKDITIAESGFGPYVTAINGLAAGTGGKMSGWCLSYNGSFPNYGLGGITLSSGDSISFHYSVNPDGATDDVGNGWYGLPIVTSLTLAGRTITLSKETSYNPDFSSQTGYYIHSQQGAKVQLQGSGASSDPFQIPITLPYGANLTSLTAAYTTSLNEHYRVVTGLDGAQNYTKGLSFSLAAANGQDKTYYKILATTEAGDSTPTPGDTISVSFRLIGSTLSATDVDLGDGGYAGASYQTWLKTDSYQLSKGATVYDLFTQALNGAGIRYTGADRNYVDTIYAPAVVGGYPLSEFTNGPRSGWMYTINGKHPGFGLKEQTLHEGDKVVWHYVNDYSYEVKDWFNDAEYPSLGDGTYYNLWLKAADANPTAPSGGGGTKDENNTQLKPSATVDKNGEARASLTAKEMENALADAKKSGASHIVIEPAVKGDADKVSVELPKESFASIANSTTAKLTVKTTIAEISLPTAALSELAKREGKTVSVSAAAVKGESGKITGEIRLEIAVDGKVSETVKGGLTVALPVTKPTGGTVLMLITSEGAEIVRKSAVEGSTLSALLSGSATVIVKENAETFADVDANHWGRDAVAFASSHGLFRGTGKNTFDPAGETSRAMLFTVLGRMEGQDTAAGVTWYESSMRWAMEQGISDGTNPDGSITREQLAAMLYRYAGSLGVDTAAGDSAGKSFTDGDSVSPWAVDAVAWAVDAGILKGIGGTLSPGGTASRAEVAAVLQRFIPLLLK